MSNTMAMKAEVAIERKRASEVIQQKVIDDDNLSNLRSTTRALEASNFIGYCPVRVNGW